MKCFEVVALVAGLVALVHCKDESTKNEYTEVKVLGQSGKCTICEPDKKEGCIQFEFDDLRELDEDGSDVGCTGGSHRFNTFAKTDFTFSPVETVEFQNITASYFKFESILFKDASPKFIAHVYLFQENGTYNNSGEEFEVYAGDVKASIEITDWNYCEAADIKKGKPGTQLSLTISIKGKGDKKPEKSKASKKKQKGGERYNIGEGQEMSLSKKVEVDGTVLDMEDPIFEVKGAKNLFSTRFPKGQGSGAKIVYDPTFSILGDDSGNDATAVAASFLTLAAAFLLSKMF